MGAATPSILLEPSSQTHTLKGGQQFVHKTALNKNHFNVEKPISMKALEQNPLIG